MILDEATLTLVQIGATVAIALATVFGTIFLAIIASRVKKQPAPAGAEEAAAFSGALANAGIKSQENPEAAPADISAAQAGEARLASDLARWRSLQPGEELQISDEELLEEILAILDNHPGEPLGHRRVDDILRENGLHVPRRRVLKVMRENDSRIIQICTPLPVTPAPTRPAAPHSGCPASRQKGEEGTWI